MESYKNPYRTGAATKPLVLAGREKELEKADTLLKSVKFGAPQHGEVEFSVPLYDEYIRRNFEISQYR